MYKIEKGRPYYFPLSVLTYTYIIPSNFEKSYLTGFWIKITVLLIISLVDFLILPATHLGMSLKDDKDADISEDLTYLFVNNAVLATCFLFALQYKEWSEFFAELTAVEQFGLTTDMEKFARNSYKFSIVHYWYIVCAILIYSITSLSGVSNCKQSNQEKDIHKTCFAYHEVWLPFDVSNIYSATAVFIVQVMLVLRALPACAMIFFVILESTELLVLHINTLKENFINLFEDSSKLDVSDKLRTCVDYHKHILRLANRLNRLTKSASGFLSLMAAIMMGCLLNQMQNGKSASSIMYLIGCIVALFFVCHAGQRIMDQTMSVGDAICASNWHKADAKTMKDLAFIILRSQKPICLEALPLGIYNYVLFVMILKTSYSYMTLLTGTT